MAAFNVSAFSHSLSHPSFPLCSIVHLEVVYLHCLCILSPYTYPTGHQVPDLYHSHICTVSSINLCLKTFFSFQTALICVAISPELSDVRSSEGVSIFISDAILDTQSIVIFWDMREEDEASLFTSQQNKCEHW